MHGFIIEGAKNEKKISMVALKDHKCNAYQLQIPIRLFLRPFCLCLTGKHDACLLVKVYHIMYTDDTEGFFL